MSEKAKPKSCKCKGLCYWAEIKNDGRSKNVECTLGGVLPLSNDPYWLTHWRGRGADRSAPK